MNNPAIWLNAVPRKLHTVPHLRTIAYSEHFPLTDEICCRSLQFCFRLAAPAVERLQFRVNDRNFSGPFPHFMVKKPGDKLAYLNCRELAGFYFTYQPETLDYFQQHGLPGGTIVMPLPEKLDIRSAIDRFLELREHLLEPGIADRLDLLCFELANRILLETVPLDPQPDERILQIASWLHSHYLEPVDWGRLAARFGCSPRTMSRKWGAVFPHTPGDYIIGLKIQEARRLLRETALPVREIARHLRFADESYFCRFFRRHTGTTPVQFRNQTDFGKKVP